jgi:nicotinate-nucleotide adenylyltransferase
VKNRVDRLASPSHRLAMTRLAFAGMPRVLVSAEEVEKATPSYTVETVAAHRQRLGPAARLFWLVGTDSLRDLVDWRDHHRLLELCEVASIPRLDSPIEVVDDRDLDYTAAERVRLRLGFLGGPIVDIAATDIRRKLAAGGHVKGLLPEPVVHYIHEHRLYPRLPC